MPERQDVSAFIRSTFRSVWSLELLCVLRKQPEREWRRDELVAALRASDLVVEQGLQTLSAVGLVMMLTEDSAQYRPASDTLDALARDAEAEYARNPDKVRRLIIASAHRDVAAFADAFRVRKD